MTRAIPDSQLGQSATANMTDTTQQDEKRLTRAQEIFKDTQPEYQELIRAILKDERDVMHLKRRNDIHQRIYDHIRRVIK